MCEFTGADDGAGAALRAVVASIAKLTDAELQALIVAL